MRANSQQEVGFLRFAQWLNVLVSRSRRLRVIVGHAAMLRGGSFPGLLDTVGEVGAFVQGAESQKGRDA